jgi:hypothetical protein
MVLDDEVQQMRGLRFDRRLLRFTEHALVEVAEQGGKPGVPFASEQVARLPARAQVTL